MNWMKTIAGEILGLFVDDGSFAAAIVVWLVIAWTLLPRLHDLGAWGGVVLFLGLAAVLFESTLRRARS